LLGSRFASLFFIFFIGFSLFLVLIIFVILIVELSIFGILKFFKCQSFASEPVNGAGDELLFDVLTQLIVKLEPLFNIRGDIVFVSRCDWRSEEVEEGFRGDGLLDDSGLLGVLVSLFLAFNSDSEILACLPVDLVAFRMIVDEVATITTLFSVEIRL